MKKKLLVLFVISLMVLVACQKDESKSGGNDNNSSKEKIEIEDGFGTQTFDNVQEKVVALEWSIVEELLTVDVQPVGVADIEGFNKWVTIDAKIADNVVDVGTRTEPNIEEIAKLEPDVIIGIKGRHEAVKDQLEKIAPVVLYDGSTPEAVENLYEHALKTLRQTAKLVGKADAAEEAITSLEEKMQGAKETVESLELASNKFLFTQAFTVNEAPTFRLFANNSIVSQVMEGMGLENIMDENGEGSGMIETSVEGITPYQESMLFYTVQEDDPLFSKLENHAGWNNFTFVKEEQLYDVGAGLWTFGSVLSMETLVDHVEEALHATQ